jgi:hypothetical protein
MPAVLNKQDAQAGGPSTYIGRPSIWGNPFVIGRDGTRRDVIAKYEAWLTTQPDLVARLPSLAGRNLVCWCAPLGCHGDVLLRLANRAPARRCVAITATG